VSDRPVQADLSRPSVLYILSSCPIQAVLLLFPILSLLSWPLSCPGCTIPSSCPFPAALSWLFCPLPWLSYHGCIVLAVLSWLSCPGYPVLVVLSWLSWRSFPRCPVLTVLSWLSCFVVLVFMAAYYWV
jgi:hypothetical protein